MAANNLTVEQISDIANAVFKQATGISDLGQINAQNFVAVANTVLLSGYDNIITAISQVLSRTIFSIRPYAEKLVGMEVDNVRYGNHIRKLQVLEGEATEQNTEYLIQNGETYDPFTVRLTEVLQTNFYGEVTYKKQLTLLKNQLDVAFSSLNEFGQFITMILQNASDQLAQTREGLKRATLANFIAAKIAADPGNVIHLLTEYNAETGESFTATDAMKPANYPAFMQWVFARIQNISDFMTERTNIYHMNVKGNIMRHTPKNYQRCYVLGKYKAQIDGMARANTFHNNWLEFPWTESVGYWQSVEDRGAINVLPQYINTSGELVNTGTPVNQKNIFGVIMDWEAAGMTIANQWESSIFNPDVGYTNLFWHFTGRYWNDLTENGVVFIMD